MSFYLETALKQKNQQKTQIGYFKKFVGKPFWITNEDHRHEHEYDKTNHKCCGWHIIGSPFKEGRGRLPCFDYEIELFDAIEKDKYVWLKKSAWLGISTFMLYYIKYKCITDPVWKGKQVVIITGPNQELAISLIKRLKALFPVGVLPETKETVAEINGVHVECYPSHHLESARGIPTPILIWLDEADYWGSINNAQEARVLAERYIGKSPGLAIVLTSTPSSPEGLFSQIERLPDNQCLYKRMTMTYQVGLGKIYLPKEIEKARQSPSFPREYCGEYLGEAGNVFDERKIQQIAERGIFLENKRHGVTPLAWEKVLAIDPGYGSSKFAMVLLGKEVEFGYLEVLYAEEFEKAGFNEMLAEISRLWNNCRIDRIFIDGSAPELISAVKDQVVGESSYNYLEQIKRYESKGWNPLQYFKVLPINFRTLAKDMLTHLKRLVDSDVLAISPASFNKLIVAMRTAYSIEYSLKKSVGAHDDLLDAMLMASQYFVLPPPLPSS